MGSALSDIESLLSARSKRFSPSMLMVEVYALTSPPVSGVMENQSLSAFYWKQSMSAAHKLCFQSQGATS